MSFFGEFIDNRKSELEVYMRRDPASRTRLEVILCYPGLHAIWFHRLNHKLWNWKLHLLGRLFSHISRWLTGIEIHPAATLGKRVFIDHGMGVVIGASAEVGDECSIYQGVTLGGTTQTFRGKRHPTLEPGVIVGAGAKVLGPIIIGAGARIGSNAVVVREVPPNATAVGIPARLLGVEEGGNEDGFSAYGVDKRTMDCEDIYAELAARVEALEAQLKEKNKAQGKQAKPKEQGGGESSGENN